MTQELYSFFLVTAPGLEQLALDEWSQKSRYLREIYPDLMSKEEDIYPRIVTGGVELFLN